MGLEWSGQKNYTEETTPTEQITAREIGGVILDGLAEHQHRLTATSKRIIDTVLRARQQMPDGQWSSRFNTTPPSTEPDLEFILTNQEKSEE